jgi:hypothetical protein
MPGVPGNASSSLWTGLCAVGFLCSGEGEEAMVVRTPTLGSGPRLSTAAGAHRWTPSVLVCRGVERCSPCRAWLRAGLRAEQFSFLQMLACVVTA